MHVLWWVLLCIQALLLVSMALLVSWAKSWRCWIIITMAWNMQGGLRMLHFLAKINTSISIVITTRCTIRPCLLEIASHGSSTDPVEMLVLVAYELLIWHHHACVLWLLLLYLGLLYHGLLCHHGLLWGHAISHVCLLVPTRLLLYLPAGTDVYACYAEC